MARASLWKGNDDGDPVRRAACPRCTEHSVLYNGTYWCSACGWVMPDRGARGHDQPEEREIIKTYLVQRFLAAKDAGNTKEMDAMAFYLVDYADVRT